MNVVYKIFRKCGDGADGGGTGVDGSVNSSSLIKNLNSLHVRNADVFLDLCARDGRVILAALAMGANTSFGFELPQNISYSLLFNAAQSMLQTRRFNASKCAPIQSFPCFMILLSANQFF